MNKNCFKEDEYLIPYEIKLSPNDLIKETDSIYDVSYNGSLVPKEYYLHEFSENSEIFKYGRNLLKNIDRYKSNCNLLYIPNKEWYSIFKVVNYNYN